MRCTQYYPVIQTNDVAGTSAFYQAHLGFVPQFDSDWYVHLQSAKDPSVNLAVLQADHETIPAEGRGVSAGLILNFEVDDVDAVHAKVQKSGMPIVKSLRDEPFGQRHFIARDPNGVLLDVITEIPPSAEFADQFTDDARPA